MSIPETMKAYVLTGHGEMDKLQWHEDWPVPQPGDHQVLVRVHACGLNNTDVNTRVGWYSKAVTAATSGDARDDIDAHDPSWGGAPILFPRIQGADICGTVIATGKQADPSLLNRRVICDNWQRNWDDLDDLHNTGYFGSECDGGFAEYTLVDIRNTYPIDSALSDAELATFSCSYTTAEGMLGRVDVSSDDTVLITGASGGVGSALIQLAKCRGSRVVALASAQKHDALTSLGADVVLDRQPADLPAELQKRLGRATVDVVADVVGGSVFKDVIDTLDRGGRYTCSGAIAGPIVDLDLRTLYLRDLTFAGSTVTSPQTFRRVVSYIERGEIRPILAAQFPLEQLHKAQQFFIEKTHIGKVVVTTGSSS